jgi:hypothetical protein
LEIKKKRVLVRQTRFFIFVQRTTGLHLSGVNPNRLPSKNNAMARNVDLFFEKSGNP